MARPPVPPRPAPGTNPRRDAEPAYAFLAALLGQAGLRIEQYQPAALLRRIPSCLRALSVKSIPEAAQRLAARPALAWSLLDVVLLGVTEFCRDPVVFQHLRTTILPQIGRTETSPRIWSAGCSEGQELYSVAGCLADLDLLERCELLGTDCRPEAIARARLGEYPARPTLVAPTPWQRNHLIAAGDSFRIHPRLRVAAKWRVGDVLGDLEAGPWHLIFCRNLAIYLEAPVATALWRRLGEQLAPGGYLITGKAENPAATGPFVRVAPCIYQVRPTC
jgi:chemotaxis methyl-accepting protein methylase